MQHDYHCRLPIGHWRIWGIRRNMIYPGDYIILLGNENYLLIDYFDATDVDWNALI